MFVGMMIDQYAGTMAIKNTTSTRWHVNVDIPEIKARLERVKSVPYEIELRNPGQGRREATEITTNTLAGLDSTSTMNKFYKLKIKITEVLSVSDF